MAAVASSIDQFLSHVRKSGLVTEERLGKFQAESSAELESGDPAAVAAKMVRGGLITLFHAKNLLSGKYKGFLLGAYKILQPIGSGGMGVVYLAEHKDLKRQVALKVLPADKARDPGMRERFYREARAAAALDHPNIVRIYDIAQGGELHFIVMEYVEGVTLHELLLKTGPLHHSQAANYAAQAAAGLAHAHAKGFVHRDIKPSNLILDKQGVVKVLDMGLTKSFGEDKDHLTRQIDENAVVGTADIISPEQAVNDPVDHRSDIYSLGATLFMLMSGRPPFEGNTAQKLVAHQLKDAPSLSKIKSAIPVAMNKVVVTMMAKKPEDRYQSAREVIEALSQWLPDGLVGADGESVSPNVKMGESVASTVRNQGRSATERVTTTKRGKAEPRRSKTGIIVALSAAVLLGGVAVAWQAGLFAGNAPDKKDLAINPPKEDKEKEGKTPPVKDPGKEKNPKKTEVVEKAFPNAAIPAKTTKRMQLDFQGNQPTKGEIASGQADNPTDALFKPWHVSNWKTNSVTEYEVLDVDGVRALSLRSAKGESVPNFANFSDQPKTKVGTTYVGRIVYRSEPGFKGSFTLRKASAYPERVAEARLTESPDEWKVETIAYKATTAHPLYVYVLNEAVGGPRIFIKSITVEEGEE